MIQILWNVNSAWTAWPRERNMGNYLPM